MATSPDARICTHGDDPTYKETNGKERAERRVRVLIADDSDLILGEIEGLLSPDFEVIGKATNGVALVEEANRLVPDLIVSDLEMPGLSGIDASRAALRERPDLPILLLTAHGDRYLVEEALGVGIRGYVLKLAVADDLIPAAYRVLRGETFISPALR